MSVSLFKYNQSAYDLVISLLGYRAAMIHFTGMGNSFISFNLCVDNKDKSVC